MLLPRSYAWTLVQRKFIIAAVTLAVILFGGLVYVYERYYRGPSESILYGRWEDSSDLEAYYEFRSDHSFSFLTPASDQEWYTIAHGRWYAGGRNIYLQFSVEEGDGGHRPFVIYIVDVSPNELRIRFSPRGEQLLLNKVNFDSPPRHLTRR